VANLVADNLDMVVHFKSKPHPTIAQSDHPDPTERLAVPIQGSGLSRLTIQNQHRTPPCVVVAADAVLGIGDLENIPVTPRRAAPSVRVSRGRVAA
jgi:hypothetical protein